MFISHCIHRLPLQVDPIEYIYIYNGFVEATGVISGPFTGPLERHIFLSWDWAPPVESPPVKQLRVAERPPRGDPTGGQVG